MQRYWSAFLVYVALISLSSTLVGCDGSSSGTFPTNATTNGNTSNVQPFTNRQVNGDLQGRVYVSTQFSSDYLDLQSGEMVKLAEGEVYPSPDGTELVELVDNYDFIRGVGCGNAGDIDRIVIRDAASGKTNDAFSLASSVYGPVLLSPDGQTVALVWGADCEYEPTLVLLDRSGNTIIRGIEGIESYAWLPDNRLVFVIGQEIVVEQERHTLRYLTLADMSSVAGRPDHLSVSPDGQSVMFEMVTDASGIFNSVDFRDATIWRINGNGGTPTQIATTSRPNDPNNSVDGPRLNMPVWSPDGQHMLATENYSAGGVNIFEGFDYFDDFVITNVQSYLVENKGVTYAIPTSIGQVDLPPTGNSPTGIRPLFGLDIENKTVLPKLNPLLYQRWQRSPSEQAIQFGSMPRPGSAGRGLTGKLYRMAENNSSNAVLQSLDLRTGQVTDEVQFADEDVDRTDPLFALSADASRSAHNVYRVADGNYLQVYESNGALLDEFPFETNNYHFNAESALKFSPADKDLLAWVYDDGDFGRGVAVLNVQTTNVITFSDKDYTEVAWTAQGDLLLFYIGEVYQSNRNADDFSNPTQLFDFKDHIYSPSVNAAGNQLLFEADRQVFKASLDGQFVNRVTRHTDGANIYPTWSPDGRFIVIKKSHEYNFSWPYIIAADATNLPVYADAPGIGAMRVGEGTDTDWRVSYTPVYWR